MDFKLYNDYEILYLIKEGNEVALSFLFKKYEPYIWKTTMAYHSYNDKREDLVQEGRIILYNCIKAYNEDLKISFFSFFTLCMKRDFTKKVAGEYYQRNLSFNEDIIGTRDYSKSIVYTSEALLEEEEDKEMYKFVILDGMSLKLYAEKKHLDYPKVYYKYGMLIKKLKEIL